MPIKREKTKFSNSNSAKFRKFRGHNTNYRHRRRPARLGPRFAGVSLRASVCSCKDIQASAPIRRPVRRRAAMTLAAATPAASTPPASTGLVKGVLALSGGRRSWGLWRGTRWSGEVSLGVGGWGAVTSLYWPHWLSRIVSADLRSIRARAAYRRR